MQNEQSVCVTKTVDSSNLANGYIEVQCSWPKPFVRLKGDTTPQGYKMTASFCHRSTNLDAKNCCVDAGLRDVSPTGFIQVISFVGKVLVGDTIDVYGVGGQ
jgi:hypothetical protein